MNIVEKNRKYWEEFYKTFEIQDPSSFAKFVLPFIDGKRTLLELGCGNARDAIFFAQNNFNVTATDLAIEEKFDHGIRFLNCDFSQLEDLEGVDVLYSRFTLHAITSKQEDQVLDWIEKNLKKGSLICIEARTTNDELFGVGKLIEKNAYFSDHFRRFINYEDFVYKMGFIGKVIYKIESKDLAICGDSNPTLMRLIVKI